MNILFPNATNLMLGKGNLLISDTKLTRQGTGLSLSHDIVKVHDVKLKM